MTAALAFLHEHALWYGIALCGIIGMTGIVLLVRWVPPLEMNERDRLQAAIDAEGGWR